MKIDRRVNNPEYLIKLARSVRPSLLFDERGSIVADMGAVSFVKNINVTTNGEADIDIVITPYEYLGIEPVLESLDGRYRIQVERGEMFDWTYHLYGIPVVTAGASSLPSVLQRFRLELLR